MRAVVLLIDADTLRGHFKRYRKGGLEQLLRMNGVGSTATLDADQLAEPDTHCVRRCIDLD